MPLNLSSVRMFLTHGLQCRNFPLLLAIILSPLVSKSQGFRGRERLPVGNISGGSRDWLTSCATSWVDLKERLTRSAICLIKAGMTEHAALPNSGLEERVGAVRRFNRFYTRKIGVLKEGLLDSPLSLTEGRVLYELAQREQATASELAQELSLDSGYLSRMLKSFDAKGVVTKHASTSDRRQMILALTDRGREMFATIDARSRDEVAALLEALPTSHQAQLVAALERVERLLGVRGEEAELSFILRPHQPGDIGWIIHRHGVLYAEEYGLDATFEALVARIAAGFIENFDARRERCWIAERDGEIVGSVLLVRDSEEIAKLRLLYVEPKTRGLGIGGRLVRECIGFARRAGYRKLTLWTNDVLVSARRIYESVGFRLVREEPHHSFGRDLVGQYWELPLTPH
jgi:DNA-binding MarR family transcriptional regulator/N-acetylglutamate synthase-like GNAT family acetyltransferase